MRKANAAPPGVLGRVLALRWWLVAGMALLGILLRLPMVVGPHREGDEVIYMSLVGQLERGQGYTLHGSPLVERGLVDREQYDRPLFFHPPGGIALFWLCYAMAGEAGFALAQIGCFLVFFASMLLLAHGVGITKSDAGLFFVALLSAFHPIMAHVTTKFWLDGPMLAFATLGAALFVLALTRGVPDPPPERFTPSERRRAGKRKGATTRGARPAKAARTLVWAGAAGVIVGYASLIKMTALLVVPGALLVALAATWPVTGRRFLSHALVFLLAAVVVQAPWELWQWSAVGSPFPQWAGKPSQTLIRSNGYVRFLTLGRSPWVYLTGTPRIVITLLPSLALLLLGYARDAKARSAAEPKPSCLTWRVGFACVAWMAVVLAAHVALGYAGYSKVLRYVILITPASILLPGLLVADGQRLFGQGTAVATRLNQLAVACIALAAMVEVATGVKAAFQVQRALLVPLIGAL